jgi:hypothetical protein
VPSAGKSPIAEEKISSREQGRKQMYNHVVPVALHPNELPKEEAVLLDQPVLVQES